MSRSVRTAATLAATLLASAAVASTASAASTTSFKQVGGKLYVTAASGATNNISLEFYGTSGGISSFRVKDLGTGVTLAPGVGIGSYATYAPGDITFNTTAVVTSVRIKSGDLNDTINTTLSPLPSQLIAGAGNDTVTAGAASATISGGAGNDTLNGGSKDDTIIGGSGTDLFFGNDGDDVIFAASDTGDDEIDGGNGDDFATVDGSYDVVSAIESIIIGD